MKRTAAVLLAAVLALSLLGWGSTAAHAQDIAGEGAGVVCGESIGWFVDGTTLYISGEGEMNDFTNGAPWDDYRGTLKRVVISNGVNNVGAYAFKNYDALEEVIFGEDITRLGQESFASCDSLTGISLPKAFKKFGEKSLYSCKNLKEIHCAGNFPRFDENCLWDTSCTIYFPAEAPWSVIYIEQLETAFHGRIEFLASDGSDPYTPTEPTEAATETTEAPTETPTETTSPETTQAAQPTMAPTLPPETAAETEAPTVTRSTEETFLLGTQPAATTEAPPVQHRSGSTIGLAIVVLALSVIGIAAVIFRMSSRNRYD